MATGAMQDQMPQSAQKILGGSGKKLHTHEVHLRRTKNKGYIARHELRDSKGNPPTDGQRHEAEYALPDKAAMLAHMEQHMGDQQEPDQDDEQQPEPAAA
jgi:hypothetical protein